jgi:hypothetical protein
MSTSKERRIADEVDKTLRSFDNDVPLEGNPFLISRMKTETNSRLLKRTSRFPLRISLTYVVVLLIVIVNLVTVVRYLDWDNAQTLREKLVSELEADFQIEQLPNAF